MKPDAEGSGPVRSMPSGPAPLPTRALWPSGELVLWAEGGVVHGLENVGMMSAFGPAYIYILGVGREHYLNPPPPP